MQGFEKMVVWSDKQVRNGITSWLWSQVPVRNEKTTVSLSSMFKSCSTSLFSRARVTSPRIRLKGIWKTYANQTLRNEISKEKARTERGWRTRWLDQKRPQDIEMWSKAQTIRTNSNREKTPTLTRCTTSSSMSFSGEFIIYTPCST